MDPGARRDGRPTLRVIPKLHIVTDDEILARPDFEIRAREVCEALVAGNSVALHLRGPLTTGQRLTRLARVLGGPAAASAITLLLNDRVDVALAVGVAGVHLGTRSLPPADVRRLLGTRLLMGVSVHDTSAAVEAAEAGADYLLVGTLFETPSHPWAAARGPEFMGQVASRVELPLIGIGGVTPERVPEVLASGGYGVAAIRGIWDAPSPPDAVQAYLDAVEADVGETGVAGETGKPGESSDL